MLNLSKIQLDLELAKEKLRSVEETIQKVEGKTFSNGPIRYTNLKTTPDKHRNPIAVEDAKNQRRRITAPAPDPKFRRLPSDDGGFVLKRGLKDKREIGLKRKDGDGRPQGVFARLSGLPYQQPDEEDIDIGKKPTLPSRVITTVSEAPSRQEVIAAQSKDEQSKERNKRMFGALVNTLQKFRKEETRVREREEKRLKVEKKLEENARREKEKLMQEKRELFLEKKRYEVEIKRIEWSLNRMKEYEAWEANQMPLKNFIQTQAKPHIFYLPRVHNTKTEERLAHTQKIVTRMIEKRKKNLKEEIENSEKKAKKAAAEGAEAEEEEAENIPENNKETCNTEEQMQVDFEPEDKENGYLEEGKEEENEKSKLQEEGEETGNVDEKMEVVEAQKDSNESSRRKNDYYDKISKDESKEETPITENKNSSNEFDSIYEGRPVESDRDRKGSLSETNNDSSNVDDVRLGTCGNRESNKDDSNGVSDEERDGESVKANAIEVPSGECEIPEKVNEETNAGSAQAEDGDL